MKKETKILFIILCVLLCCYALSFLHRPSRTGVFSSSLMREQDIREVAEIRFSIPIKAEPVEMGEMTLTKDDARFYLHTANGSYPVRQEIIDRFFSLQKHMRSVARITCAFVHETPPRRSPLPHCDTIIPAAVSAGETVAGRRRGCSLRRWK